MTARPITTPITNNRAKIVLKHTSGTARTSKEDLAKLLFRTLQITLTALVSTSFGFICESDDTRDIDRIMNNKDKLKKLNLLIQTPASINAKRTVLVRQLDPAYGNMTHEDLLSHQRTHKEQIHKGQNLARNPVTPQNPYH